MVFYGFFLNNGIIFEVIGYFIKNVNNVYEFFYNIVVGNIIIVFVGVVFGYWVFVVIIDIFGCKKI